MVQYHVIKEYIFGEGGSKAVLTEIVSECYSILLKFLKKGSSSLALGLMYNYVYIFRSKAWNGQQAWSWTVRFVVRIHSLVLVI